MWRALVFIGLLAAAAFAAVWLAERPGSVLVTWGGYEARTTVAVAAVALVSLALALAILWSAVQFLIGLPHRWTVGARRKKRERGYRSVSRGMVAVGAGDPLAARRYAKEAERLLGDDPLALLLRAQAAQVSGDRAAAEAAFRRLMDDPETRVLGLRGLFVEARRRGDLDAAQDFAQEAARIAPAATWANDAVLEAQCADGDWRGAIASVERRAGLGLVDRGTARRHRAVLLTADAQARAERDPEGALNAAREAVKLAPDLVPAAAIAGSLLARRGDLRKAARLVERAWKAMPHPELASVYLNLRAGDSTLDRVRRAETLTKLSSWDPESRLTLSRVALEARRFDQARSVLQPLLTDRPTTRACLLMADIEQAEHGNTGRVREWLARAARAPRDPAWIADGVVSERWGPVSPVTGRVDAFVWQSPPDVLAGPGSSRDDVVADLDDKPAPAVIEPPAPQPVAGRPGDAEASPALEAATPVKPVAPSNEPAAAPPEATPVAPAPGGPVTSPVTPPAKASAPERAPEPASSKAAAPAPEAKPDGGPRTVTVIPDSGTPRVETITRTGPDGAKPSPDGAASPAGKADGKAAPDAKSTEARSTDGKSTEGKPADAKLPPAAKPTAGDRPNGQPSANPAAAVDATPHAVAAKPGEPPRVVFPVEHAPDDPGPDTPDAKPSRFRLFG